MIVCVVPFFVGIIRGAIKRPLDSGVESVKTCSKTSEVEVCRSSALRGVPLDAMSLEGGGPRPASASELDQHRSPNHEFARGRFCEVAGGDNRLTAQIKEHGVAVHELSGGIDTQSPAPFDKVKLAVKRGEIDWLHIVPECSWIVHERVVTRLTKLCRVALRRGIWCEHRASGHVRVVAFQNDQKSV